MAVKITPEKNAVRYRNQYLVEYARLLEKYSGQSLPDRERTTPASHGIRPSFAI